MKDSSEPLLRATGGSFNIIEDRGIASTSYQANGQEPLSNPTQSWALSFERMTCIPNDTGTSETIKVTVGIDLKISAGGLVMPLEVEHYDRQWLLVDRYRGICKV